MKMEQRGGFIESFSGYIKKILIVFMSFIFFPISFAGEYACVVKNNVVVRKHPGVNSEKILKLKKYTPLKIVERKKNWFNVETFSKNKGWIYGDLINTTYKCATVKEGGVKTYSESKPWSSSDKRRETVNYMESLRILKNEFNMIYVKDKFNRRFWIKSRYVWPSY